MKLTRSGFALSLTLCSLIALTATVGCSSGGSVNSNPTPTPTPAASSAITRAELVGTWKIVAINAPLLTNGSPTTFNTTGTDQPCPATITNKESFVPSVGCGGASTLTFQDNGEVVNGTGQPWLTTILSSDASGTLTGISKWTLEIGALPGVMRITTTNQNVIGTIILDTKREASSSGKLRVRAPLGVSGGGGYPQFTGIQLVLEKV